MPTPHPYAIDSAKRHAWIQAAGACTLADAKATLAAIQLDGNVGTGYAILFDLRECRDDLQLYEVEQLARAVAQTARSKQGPIAFLAKRTSAFGVAHMLASFARIEGCRASAFQDAAAALAWIDDVRA